MKITVQQLLALLSASPSRSPDPTVVLVVLDETQRRILEMSAESLTDLMATIEVNRPGLSQPTEAGDVAQS